MYQRLPWGHNGRRLRESRSLSYHPLFQAGMSSEVTAFACVGHSRGMMRLLRH